MAVVALESVVSSAGGSESAWSRTQLSWMAGRRDTYCGAGSKVAEALRAPRAERMAGRLYT